VAASADPGRAIGTGAPRPDACGAFNPAKEDHA